MQSTSEGGISIVRIEIFKLRCKYTSIKASMWVICIFIPNGPISTFAWLCLRRTSNASKVQNSVFLSSIDILKLTLLGNGFWKLIRFVKLVNWSGKLWEIRKFREIVALLLRERRGAKLRQLFSNTLWAKIKLF